MTPSCTMIAPTGTSSDEAADRASSSAARIHSTSDARGGGAALMLRVGVRSASHAGGHGRVRCGIARRRGPLEDERTAVALPHHDAISLVETPLQNLHRERI